MTKMLSASGGFAPLTPDQRLCPRTPLGALPPDPRFRLVLRTRHGAPRPLTPSAAYGRVAGRAQGYLSTRLYKAPFGHNTHIQLAHIGLGLYSSCH